MKALRIVLFCLTAAVIAAPVLADHHEDKPNPADPEAMMKAYIEKSKPGPGHQILAKMAGEYAYTMTSYDNPEKPTTYTGTATKTLVMDGRYLMEENTGTMMGMPFTGKGVTAFNNATQKYETVWFDNMSSSLMTSTDGEGKDNTVTMHFDYMDPVMGQKSKVKTVTTLVDDTHHTFAYFMMMPDGSEMKMFEIAYAKK